MLLCLLEQMDCDSITVAGGTDRLDVTSLEAIIELRIKHHRKESTADDSTE